MFIRENKNRSESVSIQIINKSRGRYKVVKAIGCATHRHEIEHLKNLALQEIERLQSQLKLFKSEQDDLIENVQNPIKIVISYQIAYMNLIQHFGSYLFSSLHSNNMLNTTKIHLFYNINKGLASFF